MPISLIQDTVQCSSLRAGEDYPCGGRLLLFEVTRDEGAAPGQEKWKLVKKYVRCVRRNNAQAVPRLCRVVLLKNAIAGATSQCCLTLQPQGSRAAPNAC